MVGASFTAERCGSLSKTPVMTYFDMKGIFHLAGSLLNLGMLGDGM